MISYITLSQSYKFIKISWKVALRKKKKELFETNVQYTLQEKNPSKIN